MTTLSQYEQDIEAAGRGYQKAALAMHAIYIDNLWVEAGYSSWESYYLMRWGLKKSRVDQLLKAASFLLDLKDSTGVEAPPNERMVREVLRIKAFEKDEEGKWRIAPEEETRAKRVKAWSQVSQEIDSGSTAEDVRVMLDRSIGKGMPGPPSAKKVAEKRRRAVWRLIKQLDEFTESMGVDDIVGGQTLGEFKPLDRLIGRLTELNERLLR